MSMRATLAVHGAVALGSALGGLARALCSYLLLAALGPGFPWGTLLVNVLGSALIGLYATLAAPDGRLFPSPAQSQFVMAGFCGGFTTFSVFSLETLLLVEAGRMAIAALYVACSILLWLFGVWLGHIAAVRLNRLKGAKP
jgi:fluoride exporter